MPSAVRSPRLLLGALLAAALLLALAAPHPAAASDPDHVNFTLEGCRPGTTFTPPPFVCANTSYTTGNLGKFWNELDLVPHRLTANTGTDNSAGYSVALTADYLDGNCNAFLSNGDTPAASVPVTQAMVDAGCIPG